MVAVNVGFLLHKCIAYMSDFKKQYMRKTGSPNLCLPEYLSLAVKIGWRSLFLVLKYKKQSMISVKAFTFNPVQENTYVLYNERKECCIIDPGCYFEEERNILTQFIETQKLKPVLLLNTHCHLDHIFGNRFVHEKWKLDLHLHPNEEVILQFGPQSGKMYNLPFDNYDGPLKFITPGKSIFLGDDELKVLFTPGHSPGSVSFYAEKEKFVIGGDVLFQGSIGRTDLPGGDFDTLAESIRKELYVLPDDVIVYNGHGPETTIGTEKRTNPFVRA